MIPILTTALLEWPMSELREKITPKDGRPKLADAVRGAQIAAADRGDVVVDMKEADLARIEMLAQDLKPVFDEVPADDLQWDFAISKGQQPRLWIDSTSHVMMGRDRRTYRFVRDTRLGRIVVEESTDVRPISDAVTNYIAERIVERQRLMDGERISLRSDTVVRSASEHPAVGRSSPRGSIIASAPRSIVSEIITVLTWFAIGALTGAGVLLALFWDRLSPYF
jgi:hypothetical protein